MRPTGLGRLFWVVFALLGAAAGPAWGQVSDVRLAVEREFMGLGGVSRPGTWTPVRLTLENRGADNRAVVCKWLIDDYDGDQVVAQREATLNPQRVQYVWLYAVPAVNQRPDEPWHFQVTDRQTGELLASVRQPPPTVVPPEVGVLGVMSSADLGLAAYTPQGSYTRPFTGHEPLAVVRGLTLGALPDRWYGLRVAQALVWTSEGGDPNDASVTPAMQGALRDWVRRGGHLVIVLPAVGEGWTGSPLRDLLPVSAAQMRRVEGEPPKFLYDIAPVERITMSMTVFDRVEESGAAVVQVREGEGPPEAVVVAKRYGFGRVTLVGVDLADRRLVQMGMPAGAFRVWNTVFGWNAPVIAEEAAKARIQQGTMGNPNVRQSSPLDYFISGEVAMAGRAAPALLAAVLVFVLYFVAAGPLMFGLLKRRKLAHRAWPVFVLVVLGFTAVTWAGAWLMRPRSTAVAHFSVLDVDGRTNQVRAQSWFSLFIPDFGTADVALGPDDDEGTDTLWSPGLVSRPEDTGFLDPQPYTVDAASPDEVEANAELGRLGLPTRATAKQFVAHYVGALAEGQAGVTHPWVAPQGSLRIGEAGFPEGELRHGLPSAMKNVLIVYVPPLGLTGDARPWVWRVAEWPAEETLRVAPPNQMGAGTPPRLVVRRNYDVPRSLATEGFLGQLIDARTGFTLVQEQLDPTATVAEDLRVRLVELLTFYDALPPPDYNRVDFGVLNYERPLARSVDLTPLMVGARVVILGHLEDSPLPLPLTVDGEAVESEGRTVVRWIYDL